MLHLLMLKNLQMLHVDEKNVALAKLLKSTSVANRRKSVAIMIFENF